MKLDNFLLVFTLLSFVGALALLGGASWGLYWFISLFI